VPETTATVEAGLNEGRIETRKIKEKIENGR
jgi:hypothetical protein